jgi:hypothetical protein
MVAIILSLVAVALGVIAIIIAAKNKREVITKTEVKYGPVEHPFTYDDKLKTYVLDGCLYAKGFITSLFDEDKKGLGYGLHER